MDEKRLAKMWENSKRAEAITGVLPISGDGWEKVCVLLMERIAELEAENAHLRTERELIYKAIYCCTPPDAELTLALLKTWIKSPDPDHTRR